MKESFEHDARRNFDWKEGVNPPERDKIVELINNDGFYSTGHDESISDSNKVDLALRKTRIKISEDEKSAVRSQLEAHKAQFKDEADEFDRNDEELDQIEKELERMNLSVEDFNDKEIEFTDPVARDQFEEMSHVYRTLAERNIQIWNKINILLNTLN